MSVGERQPRRISPASCNKERVVRWETGSRDRQMLATRMSVLCHGDQGGHNSGDDQAQEQAVARGLGPG